MVVLLLCASGDKSLFITLSSSRERSFPSLSFSLSSLSLSLPLSHHQQTSYVCTSTNQSVTEEGRKEKKKKEGPSPRSPELMKNGRTQDPGREREGERRKQEKRRDLLQREIQRYRKRMYSTSRRKILVCTVRIQVRDILKLSIIVCVVCTSCLSAGGETVVVVGFGSFDLRAARKPPLSRENLTLIDEESFIDESSL